ncbi:MAG: serine dehydratase subunit alpha family protein, partial [Alistipes sp.]|nr:serine dehydratase subunit alpha family protein [Alistipes sp.]
MLSSSEREAIVALIKREVVPAIGCTEPVAVSLCVARATELLGAKPDSVSVRLSANILKNAMGVGIPGTGMIGLPIAIALGVLVGRSEYGLEVLKDADDKAVEAGRRFIEEKRISVQLKEGITEKLYIEVVVTAAGHYAEAVISGGHTTFVYLRRDDEVMLDERKPSAEQVKEQDEELTLQRVYEFATESPIEELSFILESRRLNKAAAESAFAADYG